jgi:predicted Fe-Mo cluster-binding NifX family protein
MMICFPVQKDDGMNSALNDQFGSAPMFIIVDVETNALTEIKNQDQNDSQGAYNPMRALDNQKINVIIVSGIGSGPLTVLNRIGIRVYRSQAATIQENVVKFKNHELPELTPEKCCG